MIGVRKIENSFLEFYKNDGKVHNFYHAVVDQFTPNHLDKLLNGNLNDVFVYGKHGKSRHLALWSLDDLVKSNGNLYELDPERAKDIEHYMIPDEGVEGGLRGWLVLVDV